MSRSPAEIKFRLRQEAANFYLLVAQPQLRTAPAPPPAGLLPDPQSCIAALRKSPFESAVLSNAQNILSHRFALLGVTLDTGPDIDWRRDYAHHKTSDPLYFRRLKYLDFSAVGDHKFIWELNRHQHLVFLAQAHLFSPGNPAFLAEIVAELESWLDQNPFQRGINFTSALEVAFRALSWIWLWRLCANGESLPPALRSRFLTALYRHGLHLFENLSVYFSPNTHLLGEAVVLHALGTLFPAFPNARIWQRRAAEIVEAQLTFQVKPDGSHFEQSTYYHVYAVDLFVFYYLLSGKPSRLAPALTRMAEYLHWLLGPARRIAFFGDDDGGRLFHPYGNRSEFGRATLSTCGLLLNRPDWIGTGDDLSEQAVWWLGPDVLKTSQSHTAAPAGAKLFPDAGVIFLQAGGFYLQFDAGPFGWAGAGHSHADTLSFVLWHNNEPVFTDPGTYTYVGDPAARERFRGTPAHNTISIDGLSQAQPSGPFRWLDKPSVQLRSFEPHPNGGGFIDAVCGYRGFEHRRRLLLSSDGRLTVLDEIVGPPGEHQIQQTWNLGPGAAQLHLSFSDPSEQLETETSSAYGSKYPASAILIKRQGSLPIAIAMCLDPREKPAAEVVAVRQMFDNKESGPRTS